jgi:predicted nucleotidyltransferase/uncharacterized protein YutE (UPF0331/DUF86 family)
VAENGVDWIVERVASCFSENREIVAAFLFGSAATGRLMAESDIDVAVYFAPAPQGNDRAFLELEEEGARYPQEYALWDSLEKAIGRPIDLVVLNRAPATLAASVVLNGVPCVVHDQALMDRFARAVTMLAEEFRDFTSDFAQIRGRSRSLSEIDRARLLRILDFLGEELTDGGQFANLSQAGYLNDRALRRNVERWAENLVNASIDVAKIVLASQGLPMPQTFRETLSELVAIPGFREIAMELAAFSRVRNLLAHEYLDARYPEIRRVVDRANDLYGTLARVTREWISAQDGTM